MKTEMVMPQMGESIAEATISKWLKQVGEQVKKDEIILEISTDKVDSEIPAPASGVLAEVKYQAGDVVPVKQVIAVIDSEAAAGASAGTGTSAAQSDKPESENSSNLNGTNSHSVEVENAQHYDSGGDRFFSPLVKSLAAKHGVALEELEKIPGSGQGGRLNKQDFMNFLERRGNPQTSVNVPASSSEFSSSVPAPSVTRPTPQQPRQEISYGDDVQVEVMDNMRQAIAEHMVRSKHTSPHVYSVQEVDCSKISLYRKKHKQAFSDAEGFNLSFTPFFLEAAVQGLLKFPYINSSVDGKKIILKKHINLGCAVALGSSGLIVPVIKRAEERNFVGIARALNDLALRARNKKLLPDDVMGGTFTVTNPGVFGTLIGTPIINQPQVAILCLGAIAKRPVVVNDMIGIREMCYLTLSYDHRIVDGSLGGQYLAFVRDYIENWDLDRPLR
ncbi:MAG: 2-oxo acid dehydrogenase subunit E2 [Bdellovibrionales bacterium]|nr:2-oxo acid dehydrogenase subunit E2 [Bdellovibrionales bacterium]